MPFRIQGLAAEPFLPLFSMSAQQLSRHRAERVVADGPGYPDRIELRDAEAGESLILVNHLHLPGEGPYHASHAIFVLENARQRFDAVDTVPAMLRSRLLSLRGFDGNDRMVEADVVEGVAIEPMIERFFDDPAVDFIHVHTARRGCYVCRIDRAS
jgi:hypothetical protein